MRDARGWRTRQIFKSFYILQLVKHYTSLKKYFFNQLEDVKAFKNLACTPTSGIPHPDKKVFVKIQNICSNFAAIRRLRKQILSDMYSKIIRD